MKLGTPMALPCKTSKACEHGVTPWVNPMRSNQNLRVSWKPVSPPECVWKNLYRITMRSILQEEVTIQHYNLVHKLIPMPQAMSKSCSG